MIVEFLVVVFFIIGSVFFFYESFFFVGIWLFLIGFVLFVVCLIICFLFEFCFVNLLVLEEFWFYGVLLFEGNIKV